MPHIHKDIDFTVAGGIVNRGRIALVHHRKLRRWLLPGGHVELTEDPDQALLREIYEETGLRPKDLIFLTAKPKVKSRGTKFLHTPNFIDIHRISKSHRHVVLVYFLVSKTDRLRPAPAEHFALRWAGKNQLEELQPKLSPQIKFYCHGALSAAGYADVELNLESLGK